MMMNVTEVKSRVMGYQTEIVFKCSTNLSLMSYAMMPTCFVMEKVHKFKIVQTRIWAVDVYQLTHCNRQVTDINLER